MNDETFQKWLARIGLLESCLSTEQRAALYCYFSCGFTAEVAEAILESIDSQERAVVSSE